MILAFIFKSGEWAFTRKWAFNGLNRVEDVFLKSD